MPMGPCTTPPYVRLFPRDSGVNSLPLYTMRGHIHLGFMGCTVVFLPSRYLERVLPIRLNENKIEYGDPGPACALAG